MSANTPALWRDILQPREHGSWSFAFEPVALGLLVAPSWPGAALAGAAAAVFLARRPLQLLQRGDAGARGTLARRALLALAVVAATAGGAVLLRHAEALWPLAFSVPAAALFAAFDRAGESRAGAAELAGAVVFAPLAATLALLGGVDPAGALVLLALPLLRGIPTVLALRALLRSRKGQPQPAWPPLLGALLGVAAGAALLAAGQVRWPALAVLVALLLRTLWLRGRQARALPASRLGAAEAALGVVFTLGAAYGCSLP